MNLRCILIAVFSVFMLAGCATVHVTPDSFSFPGYAAMARKVLPEIETNGYTATSLFFHAKDGTRLHGLLLTRPDARVTILVYNGDNFQLGTFGVQSAREFESAKVNAFLVEYRGYGQSEGKPTIASFKSDGLAAYDYVRDLRQLHGQPIVVYGISLGSFIAPYVALHRDVAGMVLESTATDVTDWAHNQVPWWAKLFVNVDIDPSLLKYSNEKALTRYHGPLLLLAGKKDEITPPKFAKRLFKLSATPADEKAIYISPNQNHANILKDPQAVNALDRFLDRIVLPNSGKPG